jgi:gliding motility-associated-like protein
MEGLNFDNNSLPFSGTYFADLPLDLIAASDGQTCGNFAGWEITSGTGAIADPNSDTTTFTLSSDITLVAHFLEPIGGPIHLTIDTDVAGAGVISLENSALASLPNTSSQLPGDTLSLNVAANEWYTFNHWESAHASIEPAADAIVITIHPCLTDTLIAVFDFTEHFTVDFQPGQEGGGYIVFNGDSLSTSGVSLDLEAANVYSLTAVPNDPWSTFSHWEMNGNAITPNIGSTTVLLELFENGSITAVFIVVPHFTVTVEVEPRENGYVNFEEDYATGNRFQTNNSITVELQGNKSLLFDATAIDFIDFDHWSAKHNTILGNANSKAVHFNFQAGDTIVAHFKPQPFAVYVPNSFSPNGDGINDVFQVVGNALDIEVFDFIIFDRWGQTVFHSTDPKMVWTGDFNGGQYFVGNSYYQYRLKVKSVFDTEIQERSGSIQVIR